MNIRDAKRQIKNAVTAYLQKDEHGVYKFPVHRQRPIFLIGAPGLGKTAVMEQIAGELGIGLVSYSMIHHTRQSALGLPSAGKTDGYIALANRLRCREAVVSLMAYKRRTVQPLSVEEQLAAAFSLDDF